VRQDNLSLLRGISEKEVGIVFALNAVGVAVTPLMVGDVSLTVRLAVALTGAAGGGVGGCTQHRTEISFGRSIGGGGGVVSVTVT